MPSKWLSEAIVRDLKRPGITYDAPHPGGRKTFVSGFGIKVNTGGSKTFVLRYRNRQTREERLFKIGEFGTWSVVAARDEATHLKYRIEKSGDDPQAEKEAKRNEKTVADLCDRFLADHASKRRASTARDYRGIIDKHIKPQLGKKLVVAIDHRDVEEMFDSISRRAPYRANRAIAVLSRMMTLAIKWRLRPDNPCKGLDRNPETKRKRYLTGDELARLTRALAEHEDQQVANVFRLLLLTGARKGEVLGSRWEQFDFNRNVWIKPAHTTKQKAEHEVPLGDAALMLLKAMRKAAPDAEYLFPGRGSAGHLTELKKPWSAICEAAGITGLRMHDLRHSYASFLASAGVGLHVIGSLLGHTQPQTTHRYAHLLDDPLREATNKVGALLSGVVAKRPAKRKLRAV